jgi:hypothetical protein
MAINERESVLLDTQSRLNDSVPTFAGETKKLKMMLIKFVGRDRSIKKRRTISA